MEFKIGDVVVLKSGGEPMTISDISDGLCECTWFDEKKNIKSYRFPEESIRPIGDEDGIIIA